MNFIIVEDHSLVRQGVSKMIEEKSSFKEGYKIISFYIDAASLLKRAYVLRQEGWRKKENVGYYQRMLDSKKIVGMRRYLSTEGRVFINNIIAQLIEYTDL